MVSYLIAHAQKLGDVFDVDWDDNWETEMLEENPQQVLNDCGLYTVVNLMTELLRLRGDERPCVPRYTREPVRALQKTIQGMHFKG